MNEPEYSPLIADLFRGPVSVAELWGSGNPETQLTAERTGQERWAPKRIAEFSAGRHCARHALAQLGIAPAPLPAMPNRQPAWPPGIVGSITHCAGFSAAVVARDHALRSVGIDAEVANAVEPPLWSKVLNTREQRWVETLPEDRQRLGATVIFSAKEAFYKCQYPVLGQWLEFHEADVRIENLPRSEESFDFTVTSRSIRLPGRGLVREGIVVTATAWQIDGRSA